MNHLTPIEFFHQDQRDKKILIVGDLFIDKTWKVQTTKISPEAPIPVVQKLSSISSERPGGAGIAISFLKKNFPECPAILYTSTSDKVAKKITDLGAEISYQRINEEDVIIKERYIDDSSKYHLLRVDNDNLVKRDALSLSKLVSVICNNDLACVIFMDYQKGLFDNEMFIADTIALLRERDIPIYVDTRTKDINKFTGVDIIKLNQKEYELACIRFGTSTPQSLARTLNVDQIIITKGAHGASIHSKSGYTTNSIPDVSTRHVAPDVTGCGDAFDASFCYYMFVEKKCASYSIQQAVNKATSFAYQPIESRV